LRQSKSKITDSPTRQVTMKIVSKTYLRLHYTIAAMSGYLRELRSGSIPVGTVEIRSHHITADQSRAEQ
jgi:hypothetical protein